MTEAGCLYRGEVAHARLRPKAHRFRYRVFWMLLDIDRLAEAAAGTRLFSLSRFNLLSFRPSDHGETPGMPLRQQIEAKLEAVGVALDGGMIRLLTMPRVLGYAFNPISLYYCHGADGRLAAMVYEVTSTFGERRSYVLPVEPDAPGERFRQGCDKSLHVSPFMKMDMDYEFTGGPPGERMTLKIDGYDADGLLIATAMSGERKPLTDREILRAAIALPFSTLKVTLGIHWEALRLWLKGVPPVPGPSKAA
ncbi:DUF1365 domain-containing protein [Brevundimonas kwangchunensis]|uniref:DUF1365 domain-containing protein n=1 Tax=Brevundimonas kwangchunensis TaxID=322163 RepID=A0ABP3S873_9CAUL